MTTNSTRKSPTAAEALAAPIVFDYKGTTYSIPTTSDWSYEALELFEEGKLTGFLREVLGEAQLATYKATKPRVSDLADFVGELQKALGIAGN